MRLINAKTLELEDFTQSAVPEYAILSHTWSTFELTYEYVIEGILVEYKQTVGYEKIRETCRLALEHGLEYAWVDTCCIDKRSSAELTESINSMFQWYRNSHVCFVWLSDLEETQKRLMAALPFCKWVGRGWTLQELLAPSKVNFYDAKWNFRGEKLDLSDMLAEATGIPTKALKDPDSLRRYSLSTRMSWAASRSTTRVEDMAYCLLGIFEVNMPLIYGEGEKAFRRLQEEIVKRHNDMTILGWNNKPTQDLELLGAFAQSPAAFASLDVIRQFSEDQASFSVSNKGLVFSGGVDSPPLRIVTVKGASVHRRRYFLALGHTIDGNNKYEEGIVLRKIGPTIFCRDSRCGLSGYGRSAIVESGACRDPPDYTILIDRFSNEGHSISKLSRYFREKRVHIPADSRDVILKSVSPTDLFDVSDRIFLSPTPYTWHSSRHRALVAMLFKLKYKDLEFLVVAICHHERQSVSAVLLESHKTNLALRSLFEGKTRDRHCAWSDFTIMFPEITSLSSSLEVTRKSTTYTISVEFKQQKSEVELGPAEEQYCFVPHFRLVKPEKPDDPEVIYDFVHGSG